jgi:Protein of unknown function (DUF3995)
MSLDPTLIGYPLILILLVLAGLHLYWGMGGFWPGTNEASLVEHVVGRTADMKAPPLFLCLVVAICLMSVACFVFLQTSASLVPRSLEIFPRLGLYGAAAVFFVRGLAGYMPKIFDYAKGTPFYDLNLIFYSPLCIVIGATIIALSFMRA